MHVTLTVNGQAHELEVGSGETLSQTLRRRLELTGTKIGCDTGICGACTVLVGGRLASSCLLLTARLDGARVQTVEGLSQAGSLHPLQRHFVEAGAVQCGFCTSGMLMTLAALLQSPGEHSEDDVREFIHGNYCRCTGYAKIVEAFRRAQAEVRAAAAGRGGSGDV